MRITRDHPDFEHISVLLRGEELGFEDVAALLEADTGGGYVVVEVELKPRNPLLGPMPRMRGGDRRVLRGEVRLIDRRTGGPYDPLLQAAEEAAKEEALSFNGNRGWK